MMVFCPLAGTLVEVPVPVTPDLRSPGIVMPLDLAALLTDDDEVTPTVEDAAPPFWGTD